MDTIRTKKYQRIKLRNKLIKNKKILIVGGTGFLGFYLAKKFIKDNVVTSISTRNPRKDRSVKGVKYITLDISDKDKFNKIKKY